MWDPVRLATPHVQGWLPRQTEFISKCLNHFISHRGCSVQGELGDDYVLYLLEDQEEKPVAVVLPKDAAEQPLPAAQEVRPPCPTHRPCPGRCRVHTEGWHIVE